MNPLKRWWRAEPQPTTTSHTLTSPQGANTMTLDTTTADTLPRDEHGPFSIPSRMIAPRFRQIEALETDNSAALETARTLAGQIDRYDTQPANLHRIALHSVDSAAVVWALLADTEATLPVTDRDGRTWILTYRPTPEPGLYGFREDRFMPLRDLVTTHAPLTVGREAIAAMPRSIDDATIPAAALQSALLRRGLPITAYPGGYDDNDAIAVCEPQGGPDLADTDNDTWTAQVNAALAELTPPLHARPTSDGYALEIDQENAGHA